jgi:hypothetical protein
MDEEISEELIKRGIRQLHEKTRFKAERIAYEVQDDFRFLLLSVSVDDLDGGGAEEYRSAAHLIDGLMPRRTGEYSWMINFLREGEIIDSYFGGDMNSPDSGL